MPLIKEERIVIGSTLAHLDPEPEDLGGEALNRLFEVYTQTKTYFPRLDPPPGSNDTPRYSQEVLMAPDSSALENLGSIGGSRSDLSGRPAYILRLAPVTFKFLARCSPVTPACCLRRDFNART